MRVIGRKSSDLMYVPLFFGAEKTAIKSPKILLR